MTNDTGRGTAPLEPSPEQLNLAQAQRVIPDFPEGLNDPELRLIRRPPRRPLADSYRTQQYDFGDAGSHYVLTPQIPGTTSGPSAAPPIELPVHFVSNWHPHGAASTLDDCLTAQEELTARLTLPELGFRFAVAIGEDQAWFEGFSMVFGLEDAQAVELARTSGQPAAVRWDADSLLVLPTGLRPEIASTTTGWRLESEEVATCPVRKDADPTGRCTNFGGPYGGRAIHAAALWRAHRSVAITLLGCDPCADGREPIWGNPRRGGAVSLAPEIIDSRYGGYTWRTPSPRSG